MHNRIKLAVLAALCASPGTTRLWAHDSSWVSNRTGNWSVDGNWIGSAPLPADRAFVDSGQGTVDTDFGVTDLTLNGGTIGVAHRLTISDQFNWQKGNLDGAGTIQINAGATFDVGPLLNQASLFHPNIENHGSVIWTSTAQLELGAGTFTNLGTVDFQSDSALVAGVGPQYEMLDNQGLMTKSAGTGTTSIQAGFHNAGTLSIQHGTFSVLTIGAIGTSDSGSVFDIGAATLQFGGLGMWLKSGTVVTGAGTLECLSALRGDAALIGSRHVLMNGSELAIDGDLDSGSFTWNSGALTGVGTTKLSADATFNGNWGVGAGRTLDTNHKNIFWEGGSFISDSSFYAPGNGTVEVSTDSTIQFDAENDNLNTFSSTGSAAVLVNSGTFDSKCAGTLEFDARVTNSGNIVSDVGTFLTNTSSVATGAGTVSFLSGIDSPGALTGTGVFVVGGATSNFSAASTIHAGGFVAVAGETTLNNTDSTAYSVDQVVVGNAVDGTGSATLIVPTGVTLSAGSLTALAGATLSIDGGTISATGDVSVDYVPVVGNEDDGIILKNNGQIISDSVTVNHATLDAQSGTITTNTFSVTGGTVNFAGAAHLSATTLGLTGGVMNVSLGFAWPSASLSTDGTTIALKSGVNYNFATASTITAGGVNVEGGATLSVASMSHAGTSEIDGTLAVAGLLHLSDASQLTVGAGGLASAQTITNDGFVEVNGGTLKATDPAGVSLASDSTLVGTGTISGNVHNDGLLAPGNPTGLLSVHGNLELQADSQVAFTIDATGPSLETSRMDVDGTATLGGSLLVFISGDDSLIDSNLPIVLLSGAIDGHFDSVSLITDDDPNPYSIRYTSDSVELVSAVPEPAIGLVLVGSFMLVRRRRLVR